MAILKYYNTATSAWEYIAASTTANFTSWKKTMSGGETSVSGTDDNAVTLSYTVGLEQVFINGVLQVRGTDYTATDGTSITGLSALVANDIVTVVCYAPFNVANTIAPTVVDAKGDLIAGTAADTVGRLAVGTNNQLLAADSSTATGLKWTTPANGGLTLLSTTTFSAVASHSVNDVFSSTYDNYKVVFTLSGCSADASVFMKLRVSGADSSASYNFIVPSYDTSGGASFGQAAPDSNGQFLYRIDGGNNNSSYLADLTISSPFLAAFTSFVGVGVGRDSGGLTEGASTQGTHNLATSYTGLTVLTSSGNFTGSISVYGYNK